RKEGFLAVGGKFMISSLINNDWPIQNSAKVRIFVHVQSWIVKSFIKYSITLAVYQATSVPFLYAQWTTIKSITSICLFISGSVLVSLIIFQAYWCCNSLLAP